MSYIIKNELIIKALEENKIKTYTLEAINDDFTYVVDGTKVNIVVGYHIWGLSNIDNLKKVVETLERYISERYIGELNIKIKYPCTLTANGSLTRATILLVKVNS